MVGLYGTIDNIIVLIYNNITKKSMLGKKIADRVKTSLLDSFYKFIFIGILFQCVDAYGFIALK